MAELSRERRRPPDEGEVERILESCGRALDAQPGADLRPLRFWAAVDAVKRHPGWNARFARRIANTDRRAFLGRTRLVFPLRFGVALLVLGTVVGIALLVAAFALEPVFAGIAVLLGTGALIGTTHDLAHLVVGRLVGIRFTHWFSDVPRRPQPGVKIDYESYLAVSAGARAWMHAAGAITTKLVPFLVLPVAAAASTPWWTAACLIAMGVVQLATDLLFSLRSGDWKKVRREARLARQAVAASPGTRPS